MSVLGHVDLSTKILKLLPMTLLGAVYVFNWEPVTAFIQISSLIGQILVDKFILTCNFVSGALQTIVYALEVVYEDALIFVQDAGEKLNFCLAVAREVYVYLQKAVTYSPDVLDCVTGFLDCVMLVMSFMCNTIISALQNLQYLGSSIQEFVLSTLKAIIHSPALVTDCVKTSTSELANIILDFYYRTYLTVREFFSSVLTIELNAVCGLFTGIAFVVCVVRNLKFLCLLLGHGLSMMFSGLLAIGNWLSPLRFFKAHEHQVTNSDDSDKFENEERLCVVCQVNLKNIIIFPCKHLCMCAECNVALREARYVCPICRGYITDTVKVYL